MFESIFNAISSAISSLRNWVESRINDLRKSFNNSINSLRNWVEERIRSLSESLTNLINQTKRALESSISSVSSHFASSINSLKASLENSIASVRNYLENLVNNVRNALSSAIDNLSKRFSDFFSYVNDFINSAKKWMAEAPSKAWDWVVGRAAEFLIQVFDHIRKRTMEETVYALEYFSSNMPDYIKTTFVVNMNIILNQFGLEPIEVKDIESDIEKVIDKMKEEYGLELNRLKVVMI